MNEKQWGRVIYEGITGDPRTTLRSTYYADIPDVAGRTLGYRYPPARFPRVRRFPRC